MQTAVDSQPVSLNGSLASQIGQPKHSASLYPQTLAPEDVFANVKAAFSVNATPRRDVVGPSLQLEGPPSYLRLPLAFPQGVHILLEKSDPTDTDPGGGGEGGVPGIYTPEKPDNDPSGAKGWIAGKAPDTQTNLDTDPRQASRSNSVHTPDPQDPDPYFGFKVPDPKSNGRPDPRDKPAKPVSGEGLKPQPSKKPDDVIDDPEPRIIKHKRDD